jgi:hypothetical protein
MTDDPGARNAEAAERVPFLQRVLDNHRRR